MKRVLLVDGHGVMYRAFFAVPGLSTHSGKPTNAIYGFIRMLRQAARITKPSHIAVVFDGGLNSARVALLGSYKSQRPPMPDALREQFPLAEEYLCKAGVPWIRIAGQEADDILATLARSASDTFDGVLLMTSDKDFFQIVDDKVHVLPPSDPTGEMGPAEVQDKTGVHASRIVEWLALVGDSSDNIDGVPGVGVKTAAKLLREYGSVRGIYERLESIKPDRIRISLASSRNLVDRNIELIRLHTDVDCPLDWKRAETTPNGGPCLAEFLRSLEFDSLAEEICGSDFALVRESS